MSNNNSIDNKTAQPSPAAIAASASAESLSAAKIPEEGLEKESALAPAEKDKKHEFVTTGEKIHNEITYRGVDFLLSSLLGVGFTYWAAKTKYGQEHYSKPVINFFKAVLKPVLHNEKTLEEGARWGNMFTSICLGGTAIIPPMIVLENKKVKDKIIRGLDKKIYGKEKIENDPKFEEAYQRINDEPVQDFKTGMAARFTILVPMIMVTTIPAANKLMLKYLYKPIAKSTKWMAETIGIKPAKLIAEGEHVLVDGDPNLPKQFQSNWDFIHTTFGLDAGLCIIYSFLHEYAYKAMAKLGISGKKNEDTTATLQPPKPPESIAMAEPNEKRFSGMPTATSKKPSQAISFTEKLRIAEPASPSIH